MVSSTDAEARVGKREEIEGGMTRRDRVVGPAPEPEEPEERSSPPISGSESEGEGERIE